MLDFWLYPQLKNVYAVIASPFNDLTNFANSRPSASNFKKWLWWNGLICNKITIETNTHHYVFYKKNTQLISKGDMCKILKDFFQLIISLTLIQVKNAERNVDNSENDTWWKSSNVLWNTSRLLKLWSFRFLIKSVLKLVFT